MKQSLWWRLVGRRLWDLVGVPNNVIPSTRALILMVAARPMDGAPILYGRFRKWAMLPGDVLVSFQAATIVVLKVKPDRVLVVEIADQLLHDERLTVDNAQVVPVWVWRKERPASLARSTVPWVTARSDTAVQARNLLSAVPTERWLWPTSSEPGPPTFSAIGIGG